MYSIIQNYEITKEKYDELINLKNTNTIKFYKGIEEVVDTSPYPSNAYGCEIPMKVFEDKGKYYISWSRWSSCD